MDEEHVDAFLAGSIYTTTLEACRRYEDPERGDPVDGMQVYTHGLIDTETTPEADVREIGRRVGIGLGGELPRHLTLWNNVVLQRISDAWVLCTTVVDDPTSMGAFGKACVEISDIYDFCGRLTMVIASQVALRRADVGLIRYTGLVYRDLDPMPGRFGFVKRPDPYAHQKEFRGLWIPGSYHPIAPRTWQCDDVKHLIRRVR